MLSLARDEYSALDDRFADLTESEVEVGVFESEPPTRVTGQGQAHGEDSARVD